jgi:hypothetical protein
MVVPIGAEGVTPRRRLTVQGFQRRGRQVDGHRGREEDLHQPVLREAETFDVAVGGEDDLGCADTVVRDGQGPTVCAAIEDGDGGLFPDAESAEAEAFAEAAHEACGLQHDGAGGVVAGDAVAAAGQLEPACGVEADVRLVKAGQVVGMAAVEGVGGVGGGTVHLADGVEAIGVDAVVVYRAHREGDGLAVQPDQRVIVAVADMVVGGQVLRQVDHEAGFATRSALGKARGIQHRGGLAGQDGGPGGRALVDARAASREGGHSFAACCSPSRGRKASRP